MRDDVDMFLLWYLNASVLSVPEKILNVHLKKIKCSVW